MDAMKLKKKILEDIMSEMDREDGNRLKKHPKLVAMQVEIAKPMGKKEMEMEGHKPEMEMEPGEGMKHEMDEGPEMEGIEDVLEALPEELKSKLVKYLSK